MISEIILVFSFVFAVCAAASWPGPAWPHVHFGWLAFACFVAYLLFGAFGHALR